MDINFILRLVTIILLIIWRAYWFLSKKEADIKKPKTKFNTIFFEQALIVLVGGFVFISLLGFVIYYFNNLFIQILGFILLILCVT